MRLSRGVPIPFCREIGGRSLGGLALTASSRRGVFARGVRGVAMLTDRGVVAVLAVAMRSRADSGFVVAAVMSLSVCDIIAMGAQRVIQEHNLPEVWGLGKRLAGQGHLCSWLIWACRCQYRR